jgi:hypothetical protein
LLFLLATALPIRAVAEPCAAAQAVSSGAVARCDGVLIPEQFARDALRCRQVDLPKIKADLDQEVGLRAADAAACQARENALKKALDRVVVPPAPSCADEGQWRTIVAAGAVGTVVGLVVGFAAGRK